MEQVKAITTEQEAETAVQYIVVRIGNEQYGINIKYIDNIVRNQKSVAKEMLATQPEISSGFSS